MTESASPFDLPALLTDAHDLTSFASGEPVLDYWLRQRALNNLRSAASRTYVACAAASTRIICYFALSMGQILALEATGAMRRNMPRHIPSVILGRLAIDKPWQGEGLGRVLLGDATRRSLLAAKEVSARLLIVHAISPAAEAFYLDHGFIRSPIDAPTPAVDLVKLQKLRA